MFAVYSVFSFSHSKVDILLQTQCLALNFDAKIYISAVRSQNGIEHPLPQSSFGHFNFFSGSAHTNLVDKMTKLVSLQ